MIEKALTRDQIDPRPEITEEELEEEARRYRDLDIQLGLIFQNAKEETYAQWCAWDEALSGEGE